MARAHTRRRDRRGRGFGATNARRSQASPRLATLGERHRRGACHLKNCRHLEARGSTTRSQRHRLCYDHALLVTGYDVLLSTLQGNLSFSTSSASSFALTHAGPDFSSSLTLRLRHHALSDSLLEPHHTHCLMDT